MNNTTNYHAQPFTQQQPQLGPGSQASSQQLQDIQAKMLWANYARQQQQMQNMQHAAMRAAAASGAISTSPTSSTGPGAPSVASSSIGGVSQSSPVQPNPLQSSASSQHGTPAPQSSSRPPSAAGGPLVNGSRTTSASPYVQSRHIPGGGPSVPGSAPSPAQPNGQPPDFYQQQQRAPSAMGNHTLPNGTMLNGPANVGMSIQQQQQQMMNRHASSMMPGQGGYDPRAVAQTMMGGPTPNMNMAPGSQQQQQMGIVSNGGIPLRHPQQQNQQGPQGTNVRRGPSMPPPGAPSSSAGSPMVRATSTVPNPQQQQQAAAQQIHQQNNLNQPPSLSHSSSSSSLTSDAFSQQQQPQPSHQQMQNGIAGTPRNSIPDMNFLAQQQQLRAAAAVLANGGPGVPQSMQVPSLGPMQMQQMMAARNVPPGGPSVNGIPQQSGAPGMGSMDSLSSLALQSFGLDQGLAHRTYGHSTQPQQQSPHPHPQQQQQQGAGGMPMGGMQGIMNTNKMMPPPSGPMATPRMSANVPPGFPPHQTPQHHQQQHPHPQQSPHGPPGSHAQQGHMMPPPSSHHPGQMLPPQQPHGHPAPHPSTGGVAFPGGGPVPTPPGTAGARHGLVGPGGVPVGSAHHPSSHAPGVHHAGAGVGHGANVLPLGPHPPSSSSLAAPGGAGIPGTAPGTGQLAPLAQGTPSAHSLLHQLDQVRLIQRQHEVQLRQEHAHTYYGAGTGTTREYALLLRDIVGTVNPKYPAPSGPDKDTNIGYHLQKEKTKDSDVDSVAGGTGSAELGQGGKNTESEKAKTEEKELPPPAILAQTLEQIYPPLKNVHQGTTRISILPRPSSPDDVTHGGALPALSPPSIKHIKDVVMRKDEEYEVEWREARARMDVEVKADVGGPLKWWERDVNLPPSAEEAARSRRTRLEVVWPQDGRAAREKRRKKPEIKLCVPSSIDLFICRGFARGRSRNLPPCCGTYADSTIRAFLRLFDRPRPSRAALRKPEELVPIRIDIEQEGHRLRETFVWNINGMLIMVPIFSSSHTHALFSPLLLRFRCDARDACSIDV
jgi:SWI/SNF-related matrix-associated actin-dependent regulator of chromatin subfamily B protein 1